MKLYKIKTYITINLVQKNKGLIKINVFNILFV